MHRARNERNVLSKYVVHKTSMEQCDLGITAQDFYHSESEIYFKGAMVGHW